MENSRQFFLLRTDISQETVAMGALLHEATG